ncbi:hypothetical protein BU24DRAFT_407839 [Aaosphaeria arxii CBS 175.79]|uniref:Uncharacterized protein n=1 Tax=Aaosphaeria arxii CBS 175.79 TaxID=1450172 RepID=A0A6A5XXI4_9PLEO|nr:uncharacterized protein BU24DRAFT_407839 [Aaosphaeria arxii CBS 175.79]KAF2017872.1 hypothetical protein BU24DRAFT_407839 [Aaosphaeria arxii CBS 175.79]
MSSSNQGSAGGVPSPSDSQRRDEVGLKDLSAELVEMIGTQAETRDLLNFRLADKETEQKTRNTFTDRVVKNWRMDFEQADLDLLQELNVNENFSDSLRNLVITDVCQPERTRFSRSPDLSLADFRAEIRPEEERLISILSMNNLRPSGILFHLIDQHKYYPAELSRIDSAFATVWRIVTSVKMDVRFIETRTHQPNESIVAVGINRDNQGAANSYENIHKIDLVFKPGRVHDQYEPFLFGPQVTDHKLQWCDQDVHDVFPSKAHEAKL